MFNPRCGTMLLSRDMIPSEKSATFRDHALTPCPQHTRLFAVPIALLVALALVVQFLAPGEGKFDFRAAAFIEIDLQRHQSHAFTLESFFDLEDFAEVQQQFARSLG